VADELIEDLRAGIIINAAPAEKDIASAVEAAMKHPPLVNFARRSNSLGLLKGLLRRCDLLITNDTGARHFAAALGTAVVTIFGSTDPTWAQIDYPRERILRADVPCGPCQKKRCLQPPGPTFHRCMVAIPPEMVAQAARELLASRPVRAGGGGQ
jgi:heptosyltransferase-2